MFFKHLIRRGIIGSTPGNTGSPGPATGRQSRLGGSVVQQELGKYAEAAMSGNLFGACDQGSGVAPGTALGTTACLSLYNPNGSGKVVLITKVSVGYISGTLGAGTLYHCANVVGDTAAKAAIAQPSSGTALTVYNRRFGVNLGVASAAAVALARTGSTVTTPIAIRPFCSLTALLASTAVGLYVVTEDIECGIAIEPGGCYQLQAVAAAGSTPLVSPGIEWTEIPYVF